MGYFNLLIFWLFYLSVSLILFYQIALFIISRFVKFKPNVFSSKRNRFLVLIPAYKEGETLLYTLDAIKHLRYPKEFLRIILLNDQCDEEVIKKIKNDIEVIDLDLKTHSKAQSIKMAVPFLKDFDFTVILDADNLIHPDFLDEINKCIQPDTMVIQGIRLPKNKETLNEKLDSITDFVYNEFDRLIPSKVGLTGTLSGSGFAIRSGLLAEFIFKINTTGGFDKVLQSELMIKNIPVQICPNAIVFDEKVKDTRLYIKQRSRWLYFHFYNVWKYSFKLIMKGLIHFNFNQIHLGLIILRPPLSFLYFLSFSLIILTLWFDRNLTIILLCILLIFTFILLKILRENRVLSFKLILAMPLIFFNQIRAIFKIFKAKKDSLKTDHSSKEKIEEIILKEKS